MFFFYIASILNLPSEIELAIKHQFYHNFFFKIFKWNKHSTKMVKHNLHPETNKVNNHHEVIIVYDFYVFLVARHDLLMFNM